MQCFTSLLALVALLTPTLAAPLQGERSIEACDAVDDCIHKRAETTCGSTYYSATQVNSAAQKACSYYQAGSVRLPSNLPLLVRRSVTGGRADALVFYFKSKIFNYKERSQNNY
jgi:hypothetical protein